MFITFGNKTFKISENYTQCMLSVNLVANVLYSRFILMSRNDNEPFCSTAYVKGMFLCCLLTYF